MDCGSFTFRLAIQFANSATPKTKAGTINPNIDFTFSLKLMMPEGLGAAITVWLGAGGPPAWLATRGSWIGHAANTISPKAC